MSEVSKILEERYGKDLPQKLTEARRRAALEIGKIILDYEKRSSTEDKKGYKKGYKKIFDPVLDKTAEKLGQKNPR